MKAKKSREAFSLLTAIVIIVLMSTVAMFVMSLSGKIIKSTTAQFQREQAELYAKAIRSMLY
jgi:type II secretory pathway pseudopilin PulG